jgi:hypothetical protein
MSRCLSFSVCYCLSKFPSRSLSIAAIHRSDLSHQQFCTGAGAGRALTAAPRPRALRPRLTPRSSGFRVRAPADRAATNLYVSGWGVRNVKTGRWGARKQGKLEGVPNNGQARRFALPCSDVTTTKKRTEETHRRPVGLAQGAGLPEGPDLRAKGGRAGEGKSASRRRPPPPRASGRGESAAQRRRCVYKKKTVSTQTVSTQHRCFQETSARLR